MKKDNILEVKDLHVDIHMSEGLLTAVRGVNFEMKKVYELYVSIECFFLTLHRNIKLEAIVVRRLCNLLYIIYLHC